MAARFTATINAFNRGIENTKAGPAGNLIEDWETAVADLDAPGAKGIARDLAALRKALDRPEPDAQRIDTLLHRLGEATLKIADRAPKKSEQLKELGEALRDSGVAQDDEDRDVEAAAQPKRRSRQGAKSRQTEKA